METVHDPVQVVSGRRPRRKSVPQISGGDPNDTHMQSIEDTLAAERQAIRNALKSAPRTARAAATKRAIRNQESAIEPI